MPRLLVSVSLTLAVAASAITACSDDPDAVDGQNAPDGSTDGTARRDGATDNGDDGGDGGGEADEDGGAKPAGDAGKDAKPPRDANGPGKAGDDCFYNHDCALALRCGACDGGYCFCEPGARGTGQNGIDACDGNEQCASALCVEEICSDECEGDHDCTPALPRCVNVGFTQFCSPPAK